MHSWRDAVEVAHLSWWQACLLTQLLSRGKQAWCHQAKPSVPAFQEGAAPDRQDDNGEILSRWTTAINTAGTELIKLSPVLVSSSSPQLLG